MIMEDEADYARGDLRVVQDRGCTREAFFPSDWNTPFPLFQYGAM